MGLSLCSCLLLASAVAPNAEVKALVARLEARYRSARELQATFLERYSENGRLVRVESGKVFFRRPGRMRWEYESPEKNLFLVDGKTAWFYVPADHTVTRVPAKESTDWRTPLALLAGEAKVSRICSRVDLARGEGPQDARHVLLHCQLRGANRDRVHAAGLKDTVLFEVARESGELVRLIMRQAGGVQVEFWFENWRENPPVPDSLFQFEVPPGVAIVNGELPAADSSTE